MKKICLIPLILLTACTTEQSLLTLSKPDKSLRIYSTSMYAKGNMSKYKTDCPGCHVENFDRADLVVAEISNPKTNKTVDECHIIVEDSLQIRNIQTNRYVPATSSIDCETLFNKEQSYLKAMGFSE